MIYDIKLENILSYKDETTFSMEGIETDAKERNYVRLGDYGKCLKTAVIYGPNASGKTNLLRFLGNFVAYLRGNFNWQQEDRVPIYLPFAYDKHYFDAPSKFEIRFFLDSLPQLYTYKLRFDKKSILEETLLLDNQELFSRIVSPVQDRYVVEGQENGEPIKKNLSILNRYVTLHHEKISAAANFLCNLIVVVRSDDNDVLEYVWRADMDLLRQDESYLQIVKDLLHSIDVSFVDILVPDGDNVKLRDIVFVHKVKGAQDAIKMPMYLESQGTKTLFVFGIKIIEALRLGYPFFIDELDSSFHSTVTKYLLSLFHSEKFNKNHAQLILTSHDLKLMDEKCMRIDQIWIVEKKHEEDGSTLHCVSDYKEVTDNTEIEKWYLANRFGGLPDIDNLKFDPYVSSK